MEVIIKVKVPNLGRGIKQQRIAAGLSPAMVVTTAGMSVSNLYLIESGKAQALPEETLKRLSGAIGIDFVNEIYQILSVQAQKSDRQPITLFAAPVTT